MSRIIVSCSLTQEQKDYVDAEKLSPTNLLQGLLEKMMTGAYDADREGVLDEMVARFFKKGRGRPFAQCKDWLESPTWKEDLKEAGLTPLGFMSICRKRVESMTGNGIDPVMQFMVGIIEELPPSAVNVPKLSDMRRRHIERQAALANQWEKDREAQEDAERAD